MKNESEEKLKILTELHEGIGYKKCLLDALTYYNKNKNNFSFDSLIKFINEKVLEMK